jgi:predicted aldo/keto reductase-like oxidoreductase
MLYREFGKTGQKASILGFGAMRLPVVGDDKGNINEPEATRMLHYAIDNGVNYVDSAYGYHKGNSERFLGRALEGGYREKVHLATKMPIWMVKSADDFDRLFEEQLEKLQTDRIDFYLFHALNAERWGKVEPLGIIDWAEKAINSGKIGWLGFSFHGKLDEFKTVVDGYEAWSFCQIQYNYMNETVQAGTEGLEYAAARGMAVVVMEPLLGGSLADPPQQIVDLLATADRERKPVEWALRWLWNKKEVTMALSGMSTMDQVEQNVAWASSEESLSREELDLIARVRDRYDKLKPVPCTQCEYCMPCPSGVNIPRVFYIYNYGKMYNDMKQARMMYGNLEEGSRASACTDCKQCEDLCPQSIEISAFMPQIHRELSPR